MKPPKTIADYIRFCRRVCKNSGMYVVRRRGQFGYYDPAEDVYTNLYYHNVRVMFPDLEDYAAAEKWTEVAGHQNADDIDVATGGMRSGNRRANWIRALLNRALAPKGLQ
jgi:hypothetical protein